MNYQQQNMYGGNSNMDGTPIEFLRQDLKSQQQNNKDDETNYSVGSIDTTSDIHNLVKEINTNIESKQKENNENKNENNTDTDTEESQKSEKSKKKKSKLTSNKLKNNSKNNKKNRKNKKRNFKKSNLCNTWEDYLYDFILLFIIFMLMSQEFVKNFIGSKIKIINVNDKGFVPFSGVVVYGFIFVTIFICMKILINKAIEFSL
jgi:cation transport ATPase